MYSLYQMQLMRNLGAFMYDLEKSNDYFQAIKIQEKIKAVHVLLDLPIPAKYSKNIFSNQTAALVRGSFNFKNK